MYLYFIQKKCENDNVVWLDYIAGFMEDYPEHPAEFCVRCWDLVNSKNVNTNQENMFNSKGSVYFKVFTSIAAGAYRKPLNDQK